jgi:hypothetical protein
MWPFINNDRPVIHVHCYLNVEFVPGPLFCELHIGQLCCKKEESEWVSDCRLMPPQQFCLAISWREQVNFQWDDDDVRFVPDQHA